MNAKAKIQAQLSAYLDGELEEAQVRQVEDALENDGELRAELADLAAARKLLRDLPAEKPPIDLVSRVLAEAERSQLVGGQTAESGPDAMRWVRYAASAAVLLVAATVGMVIAFTLCSPNIYKDNLAHRGTPDKREDIRDDKTSVVVADGKRTGTDEDLDREKLGRLATRDLPVDGPVDGVRELRERGVDLTGGGGAGGGGAGGHFINGNLGTLDENGRSGTLVLNGGIAPGGTSDSGTTVSGGTLTLSKNGDGSLTWSKGGEGNLSGSNTYTGGTTVSGGTLTLTNGGEGELSGSNTYTGVTTVVAGTQAKNGTGILDMGVISGKDGGGSGGGNWNDALAKGKLNNNDETVSGPFANVDNMSRVLAGNTTNNTIIYTDRLDLTQRQVETVLNANGIASVTTAQSEAPAPMGKAAGQALQARGGNVYVANTLSPAQVQYEAYVTPEQLAKVQKDLDSLRARQNVSQDVPALAYNEANAKNRDYSYKKDLADKDGEVAGKEFGKLAGIALARADGDSGGGAFRRKLESESQAPVAKAIPPAASSARPAPESATAPPPAATTAGAATAAPPAVPAPGPAPAAKPGLTFTPAAPVVAIAPPAPGVAVAPGGALGEEAGRKAKNDVRTPAKDEDKLAEAGDRAKTQPAEKPAPEGAEVALAPSVGAKPGGGERSSAPARSVAARPGGPRVAATSGEKAAPNVVAKPGDPAAPDVQQISSRSAERMPGQAAGPVGGQRAEGIFNPPTTSPASAPATNWLKQQVAQAPPDPRQSQSPIMEHGERDGQAGQVVRVGVVRQAPLTQSGGTVTVRFATPPGQAGRTDQIERDLATANVQKLVITLNYRQAGEAGVNVDLDRTARLRAAASQAAPAQAPPAAGKAAQESK